MDSLQTNFLNTPLFAMKQFKPESLMMTHGYQSELSQDAIKPPVFLTSTFAFKTAEEGKRFFELAYGIRAQTAGETPGLIYSRINNPNMEIFERRLQLFDGAAGCAVFGSGMAAISTVMLACLRPGDLLVHNAQLYGGTHSFIMQFLAQWGVTAITFDPGEECNGALAARIAASGLAHKLALLYLETPANPTNGLIDIAACKAVAQNFETNGKRIYVAVDNTYMGPLWQQPLRHGADFSLYSATKYIGGHSDLIAGACCGTAEVMPQIKSLRTLLGNMAAPHTAWLLTRSLETLTLRMERQNETAQKVAAFLNTHPKISKVYYLGLLTPSHPQFKLYKQQYSAPGAMLAFDVVGGAAAAYVFLNSLQLVKLAVSLGSTESLAQHPATMTHVATPPEVRAHVGITDAMVRFSVGIEDPLDLIADLTQALALV